MHPVATITTALLVALVPAACSTGPQAPEPPLERPSTTASAESLQPCGADGLAGAAGRRLVQGPAGQGELSLEALPEPYRIVAPGRPTDLSFQPDRLTVTLTGDGLIRQLTCG